MDGDRLTDGAPEPANAWKPRALGEVEKLCDEIALALRETVELARDHQHTIAAAAWQIADPGQLSGPEAGELAREVARIAGIEDEIEAHLAPSQQHGTDEP